MKVLPLHNVIKTSIITLSLTVLMLHAQAQSGNNYIEQHKPLAIELSQQYGIPPQVILAIALIESAAGKGKAAKMLNNHFGIVGKNKLSKKKAGFKSRYKQYDSEEDSYEDFCKLISGKAFYYYLRDNQDSRLWVKAIAGMGYSTQPIAWQKNILKTIAANKL